MTVKEKVAMFIAESDHAIDDWYQFQSVCPQVRVKSISSKDAVLINFEGKEGWFTPSDWLANYQSEIQLRLTQELARARNVLPQERLSKVIADVFDIEAAKQAQTKDCSIRGLKFIEEVLEANAHTMGQARWLTQVLETALNIRVSEDWYKRVKKQYGLED